MERLKRKNQALESEKKLLQEVCSNQVKELSKLQQLKSMEDQLIDAVKQLRCLMQEMTQFEQRVHAALSRLSEKCDRALIVSCANECWTDKEEARRISWKLCVFKDVMVSGRAPGYRDGAENVTSDDVEKRLAALSFANHITRSIMCSAKAGELLEMWASFVQTHVLQICSVKEGSGGNSILLSKEVFYQVLRGGFASLFEQCPGLILEAECSDTRKVPEKVEKPMKQIWRPLSPRKSLNWERTCAIGRFAEKG